MNEIAHDPRTKQQLKDAIYNFLYAPVKRAYDRKLQQIIQKNSTKQNSPFDSFMHRGQIYVANPKSALPRKMLRLSPDLVPEMDSYLKEVKHLNDQELPYVMGFVNQVLNASNTFEDYLRILPPSIHPPIRELQATCPCKVVKLTPEDIQTIQEKNQVSIDLLKERQVRNMLL